MAELITSTSELNRLDCAIVIRPEGMNEDLLKIKANLSQGINSEDYRSACYSIHSNKNQTLDKIKEAYKRLTLYNVSKYMTDKIASDFPDDVSINNMIPALLQGQTRILTKGRGYNLEFKLINDAYEELLNHRNCRHLSASGRVEGAYVFNLRQVIIDCSPSIDAQMKVSFGGRKIRYSYGLNGILDSDKIDYPELNKNHSLLFPLPVGRIVIDSPEDVGYAAIFLEKFFHDDQLLPNGQVSNVNGRSLEKQFSIEDMNCGDY